MSVSLFADPDHQPFTFGEGPARALLVPGFMGTPKEMRPLGRALAEAGIAARGVLLPGFGPDVARLRTARAADWVRSAAAAWDEVRAGATRTTLVGFSMGGAVALVLAARRPPDRLILLAPHWRFADRRAQALPLAKYVIREIRPFGNADFSNRGVRQAVAELAGAADLDDPATQARLRRETVLPTAALDELRRVSTAGGAAARRVTVPTLVVQGRADRTVLAGDTRLLAVRLGGPLHLEEVPGGHLLVDDAASDWGRVRSLVTRFATGTN